MHLFRLKGSIQQYDWGKPGSSSRVARYAKNAVGDDYNVDQDKSYAEVWMGTHPNGPAAVYSDPSTPLYSLMKADPVRNLGSKTLERFPDSTHIPFLFKVLSIGKALPLQVHPDKALAALLHEKKSDEFVDSNHKPEIALALPGSVDPLGGSDNSFSFTGFVGFRPLDKIKTFLQTVPELRDAVDDTALLEQFAERPSKDTLRAVYTALLSRPATHPGKVEEAVTRLAQRVQANAQAGSASVLGVGTTLSAREIDALVLKITAQYPRDVGVFATVFFMNLVRLLPGEAVYIGADEVHAYLEGDIIECMAFSDNVLNAAFAPPAEVSAHVPTFVHALTYTARPASHWSLVPEPYNGSVHRATTVYAPPLEEFIVLRTRLGDGGREVLKAVMGPTIGIVVEDAGGADVVVEVDSDGRKTQLELGIGGIFFVTPGNEILLQGKPGTEIYLAACLS